MKKQQQKQTNKKNNNNKKKNKKKNNNNKNKLHYRALRLVYSDCDRSYEDFLKKAKINTL